MYLIYGYFLNVKIFKFAKHFESIHEHVSCHKKANRKEDNIGHIFMNFGEILLYY